VRVHGRTQAPSPGNVHLTGDCFAIRCCPGLTIALATVRYFGAASVGERIATKRLAGSVSRGASGSATGQTQRDLLVAKLGLLP
jgi:hypothetical protein